MQAKRLLVTITILFNFLLSSLSQAQGNRPIDFPDTALPCEDSRSTRQTEKCHNNCYGSVSTDRTSRTRREYP